MTATVMPHLSRPRFAHGAATIQVARVSRKTLIINAVNDEFGFSRNITQNHDSGTNTCAHAATPDEKMPPGTSGHTAQRPAPEIVSVL